jgi:Sensors of blue-light using FAD
LALLQIIYVSRCLIEPAELPTKLEHLLATSRASNRNNAITGCLACEQGLFIQVIEGDASRVEQLFARIQADDRHKDVTVRMRREVRARSFPDWGVAHVHPGSPGSDKIAGTPWGDPLSMPPVLLLSHLMALADASRR